MLMFKNWKKKSLKLNNWADLEMETSTPMEIVLTDSTNKQIDFKNRRLVDARWWIFFQYYGFICLFFNNQYQWKLKKIKNKRNMEIVDELVEKAKINREDLTPIVQNIYLTDSIASEEYKLLELDQAKLDYLLQGNRLVKSVDLLELDDRFLKWCLFFGGKSLVIRGNETENAVCCTQTSTYSFKVAEISNPLLVCSNLNFANDLSGMEDAGESSKRACKSVDVVFMTNSYFLMNKEKPKLQKLKSLLETNLYYGRATDANNDAIKVIISFFF